MGTRLELHAELLKIFEIPEDDLEEDGPTHWGYAYFQPPPSIKMEYPCIRYKRAFIKTTRAANSLYSKATRYQVTAITTNPDDTWPFELLGLPLCRHDRSYTVDGLTHEVFEIYF